VTAQTLPFPVRKINREGVDTFKLALCCVMYLMPYNWKDARMVIGTWRKHGFLMEHEADALLGFYGMDSERAGDMGAREAISPLSSSSVEADRR
jgi:hypothetical protein